MNFTHKVNRGNEGAIIWSLLKRTSSCPWVSPKFHNKARLMYTNYLNKVHFGITFFRWFFTFPHLNSIVNRQSLAHRPRKSQFYLVYAKLHSGGRTVKMCRILCTRCNTPGGAFYGNSLMLRTLNFKMNFMSSLISFKLSMVNFLS